MLELARPLAQPAAQRARSLLLATAASGLRPTLVAGVRRATTRSCSTSIPSTAPPPRSSCTRCSRAAPTTRPSTRLLERSGGNPFFVEELVAYVQDSERAGPAPGDGLLRDLPATLHGLVAARLDALEPAERSLLEDCAVVGGSGPIAAAFALAGREDAPRLLERLTERDLLVLDGDEFHFKSELIREIAYGTLTKAERARRHADLAPIARSARRLRGRPGRRPPRDRGASSSRSSGRCRASPPTSANARSTRSRSRPATPRRSSRGSCRAGTTTGRSAS